MDLETAYSYGGNANSVSVVATGGRTVAQIGKATR
jgi:hypothetical protein